MFYGRTEDFASLRPWGEYPPAPQACENTEGAEPESRAYLHAEVCLT
jgi:hypothetical protein